MSDKKEFEQWLFSKAIESKKYYYETEGSLKHKFYDDVVFKKVRNYFGGRIKVLVSASAPISAEVLTFYKVALGIHVYECYGQTEISGPATYTHPADIRSSGTVGGPIPAVRIRLRDCPELGYLATDNPPRGEV